MEPTNDNEQDASVKMEKAGPGCCSPQGCGTSCCDYLIVGLSILLIAVTFPVSLCLCFKIVAAYERAIIFRLGRVRFEEPRGPGLCFIIPCADDFHIVDLRTVMLDVPPQEILTMDSVSATVDAIIYYKIFDPMMSVMNVADVSSSTSYLAQTTLRKVLGSKELTEILAERDTTTSCILEILDEVTKEWGVVVERVEIKNVTMPTQLQRAMAAEAEATREASAKVIAADGEWRASQALKMAAETMATSPGALQLRYLQTLNSISAGKNSTIIFPLPMDLLPKILGKS